jgi:hypothetical protein
MNGHVFQCHGETTDKQQYTKTVEALGEYISKELKHAKDVSSLYKTGKIQVLKEPVDLTDEEKKSDTKRMIWTIQVASYVKRIEVRESNRQTIYTVIWGQCSVDLRPGHSGPER